MTRVSVGTGDIQGDNNSQFGALSGDGRYVVFESVATNLVGDDGNAKRDIFLHDTQTGTTTRVSVDTGNGDASNNSSGAAISGDGRYVVFGSVANDLIAGDTNGSLDIFVRDVQTGTSTRVSVATGGGEANSSSLEADISADGRTVVFNSFASNLVTGDTNGVEEIFTRDLQTGTTTRVSVADDESQANGRSIYGDISGDGQRASFVGYATNLVADDTNGVADIFVRDVAAGTTERVSVATDGTQANDESSLSVISGNGRYVVFQSDATNLVAGDTNGAGDIFLRDLQTDTTVRVSVSSTGVEANSRSANADISADGRYVVFISAATNLVAGPVAAGYNVYVRDMLTGTVTYLAAAPDGSAATAASYSPRISADGSAVVFHSGATNLDLGTDTNGRFDVFRVSLRATAGADHMIGSDAGETTDGLAGDDILTGGLGDDTLIGGAGADRLFGGDGSDTADYSGSAAAVTVSLKSGNATGGDAQGDTLTSIENMTGSALADGLYGDSAANRLTGGAGNDALWGGAGADILDGGAGSDHASYQLSAAAVTVDLLAGTGSGGDAQGDTLTGIETLYGSIFDDLLTGNNVGNTLRGDLGNDTLVGNGGADTLVGEGGNDTLDGGDGNDRLIGLDGVDIIHGGNDNDSADAGDGNDVVFGDAGIDSLGGNTGDDQLDGGDGNDFLEGGAGADVLIGGAGIDAATYTGSGAGVTVNLALGTASGGDAQGDTFNGIEQVIGSAYADKLTGDAGANSLWGQDGNDILVGGAGADALNGGNGIDTVSYVASAAGVTVNLATGAVSGGDAAGDTFNSIEQVLGSNQGDRLTGDAAANTLWGGNGDDVITGGLGADFLKGGAGNDSFVYTSVADSTVAAAGKDTVADFTTDDKIDLSAIDADGATANGDTAFSFGPGGFTGVAGELRVVDFGDGRQGVYLDVNGDKSPDSIIVVYADHALTAADMVL
ncbi:beta strand repeat-containing protein [Inquilinus sp. OTU3971]|uniref:beta strand repeat-containing protein n=1 Tax=Inquilinus sp. OTU3971 TaxID=3043855 RepID=UPI00313B5D24